MVDTVAGSAIANLKELRPPSSGRSEIRIIFVFDPWRCAVLLVAGDKSGQWQRWYRTAIPMAEDLYRIYLKERQEEVGP
ncbi:type II toxin-antitoxin system RelE/ParE family toxin [Dactylosporangium sp. AC04546]|uniref:type II toxin-antitoxin system RelE/ParE family toxin n=1 Tax=Dactylosporangium sp. AC04546 TaxID=2862460 RepID=UPI003FA44435